MFSHFSVTEDLRSVAAGAALPVAVAVGALWFRLLLKPPFSYGHSRTACSTHHFPPSSTSFALVEKESLYRRWSETADAPSDVLDGQLRKLHGSSDLSRSEVLLSLCSVHRGFGLQPVAENHKLGVERGRVTAPDSPGADKGVGRVEIRSERTEKYFLNHCPTRWL